MPRVERWGSHMMVFHCPACGYGHPFYTSAPTDEDGVPITRKDGSRWPTWQWNGSLDRPTFTPSLVVHGDPPKTPRCHSFVTDGKIQYLDDCTHAFAGQTIDLPEVE